MTNTSIPQIETVTREETDTWTLQELVEFAQARNVPWESVFPRKWATEVEVDAAEPAVIHRRTETLGGFDLVLEYCFLSSTEYGTDVTVRWEPQSDHGSMAREEFVVQLDDLDGLIAALQHAKATLTQ